MSDVITASLITAAVGIASVFSALHIHYNARRPALVVAKSPKEDYFQARITVHNRNDTAYSYRIRVHNTYLKWQSEIVTGSDKTIATLPRDHGSGVILDEVIEKLPDNDIIIECYGWRPWPWSKIVYRQRFKNL